MIANGYSHGLEPFTTNHSKECWFKCMIDMEATQSILICRSTMIYMYVVLYCLYYLHICKFHTLYSLYLIMYVRKKHVEYVYEICLDTIK